MTTTNDAREALASAVGYAGAILHAHADKFPIPGHARAMAERCKDASEFIAALPAPAAPCKHCGKGPQAYTHEPFDDSEHEYAPQAPATGGDAVRLISLIERAHDEGEVIEGMLVRNEFREWCLAALNPADAEGGE